MSDANKLTVTYDPAFNGHPDLLEQVRKAHSFFSQWYLRDADTDGHPPARVEWRYAPDSPSPLAAVFHETDVRGERSVEWVMSRSALADEVSRNVNMIKFWGKVLEARTHEHLAYRETAIRKAERTLQGVVHD